MERAARLRADNAGRLLPGETQEVDAVGEAAVKALRSPPVQVSCADADEAEDLPQTLATTEPTEPGLACGATDSTRMQVDMKIQLTLKNTI